MAVAMTGTVRRTGARGTNTKARQTQDFYLAVYHIIQMIPPSKVITCAQVAQLLGAPKHARRVKEAVTFISHTSPPVPWHRVVPSSGILSVPSTQPTPARQQRALEAEGVPVYVGAAGEVRVRVAECAWAPSSSPSHTGEGVKWTPVEEPLFGLDCTGASRFMSEKLRVARRAEAEAGGGGECGA